MKTKIDLLNFFILAFALFTISSCSNDSDFGEEHSSSQQKHLQQMKQLCSEYGWDRDEDASQEEFERFLLSTDYNTAKDFFELVKTGGTTAHAQKSVDEN